MTLSQLKFISAKAVDETIEMAMKRNWIIIPKTNRIFIPPNVESLLDYSELVDWAYEPKAFPRWTKEALAQIERPGNSPNEGEISKLEKKGLIIRRSFSLKLRDCRLCRQIPHLRSRWAQTTRSTCVAGGEFGTRKSSFEGSA